MGIPNMSAALRGGALAMCLLVAAVRADDVQLLFKAITKQDSTSKVEDEENCLSTAIFDSTAKALMSADTTTHFVSNLRRAIDTWTVAFYRPTPLKATLTGDIQEVGMNRDCRSQLGGKCKRQQDAEWSCVNGIQTRPCVGTRQRETLKNWCGTAVGCADKLVAVLNGVYGKKGQPDRSCVIGDNSNQRSDILRKVWGCGRGMENDAFINQLRKGKAASGQKKTFVASGHSNFWKQFVKTYSDDVDSCKDLTEEKLHNGAVAALVLDFSKTHKPIIGCRLVFGRMHDHGEEKGRSCADMNERVPFDLVPKENQAVLFIIRHGTSVWNEQQADGSLFTMQTDAPLTKAGFTDALRLYNALN